MLLARCLLLFALILLSTEARSEGCPTAKDEIATDRPDVTNSSLVVPTGSLQNENGMNFSMRDDGRAIDGTNSRWRLGVAPCLELLVDLPTYVAPLQGSANRGFSDVSPAVKWQISPVPGKVDLSVTFGVALPTGSVEIAGRGAQPYLQLPWSWELHDGWGVSGMLTEFFRPDDFTARSITETTFVLEKKLTDQLSLFTEYVGDYPQGGLPSQLWNSGAVYHIDRLQQAHAAEYRAQMDSVTALPGARELLAALTDAGVRWAIATSGYAATARPALALLGLPEDTPMVTRDLVRHAKPDPDLFLAAAARLGVETRDAMVVGDSVWDLLAARRAGALGVGLLSGGYGREELERAGAYRVYADPAEMLARIDELGVRTE